MDVLNIDGSILLSVPITPDCQKVEELMQSDRVELSWNAPYGFPLPAGCRIVVDDKEYSLLDVYYPTQNTEGEWRYTPQFESSVMRWRKIPFFMYTPRGDDFYREIDWSLTAPAQLFLDRICNAISIETGVTYTYAYGVEGSKTITFSSSDIYSALNAIATAFETEWWVDDDVIHLSRCEHGSPVSLRVGDNISVPSVSLNTEGYFNRFYVFGSTRNIVQSYTGANVNNLVNRRLTLDPAKYPDGYYEIGSDESAFSKILVFDDIYPAAKNFHVHDLIARTEYVLDDSGRRIQIGTNSQGQPIYDMCTIWYFQYGRKKGDSYEPFVFNDWDYSEDPRVERGRDGMKIKGLNVSISFQSGALRGREFEVRYLASDSTFTDVYTDEQGEHVSQITIPAGYWQINYVKEGNYTIPDQSTLVPGENDEAILFNLKMPDSYLQNAYDRLEERMLKEIDEKYNTDRNQYTFASCAASFKTDDPHLKIGSRVHYENGDYSLDTRVTAITRRLDYPFCQSISISNGLIKGTLQELREEATQASRNIDVIAALNETTSSLANAYSRAQQNLIQAMDRLSSIWIIHDDCVELNPAYKGLFTTGYVSAGGKSDGGGGGGGALADLTDVRVDGAAAGDTLVLGSDGLWHSRKPEATDGDRHFTFEQMSAQREWSVVHNLGKYPSVSVVDSAGTAVVGDVTYLDTNRLKITFSAEFSGTAYMN